MCNVKTNLLPPENPSSRITLPLLAALHTRAGASPNGATMRKFKSKILTTSTCNFCGVVFTVEAYRIGRVKFCGLTCKQKHSGKIAGQRNIERLRGTGSKTYVKFYGRHQHRVVAEQMIGRALLPGEIVHHKDGNKKNNHPSNLQVMTASEHAKHHFPEMMAARKIKAGY